MMVAAKDSLQTAVAALVSLLARRPRSDSDGGSKYDAVREPAARYGGRGAVGSPSRRSQASAVAAIPGLPFPGGAEIAVPAVHRLPGDAEVPADRGKRG